jgi:hypothetical protein
MIYGCACDTGYEGYDCRDLSCPFGDDPGSSWQQFNEIQEFSCDGSGAFMLSFRQHTTASLASTSTASEVKAALEALDSVAWVSVYLDDRSAADSDPVCDTGGVTWYVEFLRPTGDVPLITSARASGTALTIEEKTKGSKEWIECSGRGICDHEYGECLCVTGYESSDGQGGPGLTGDCGHHSLLAFSE